MPENSPTVSTLIVTHFFLEVHQNIHGVYWLSSIPTGIEIIQPGVAKLPQVKTTYFPNPERIESIPYILFIKFNLVAPEKLTKFILKQNLAISGFYSILSGLMKFMIVYPG
jgi:hypothetical protein